MQDHAGLSTAILVVFLDSACNLPVSGDMVSVTHTLPALCPPLSNAPLKRKCLLVLQRNPFDYLNGEYRAKKLSRFAKVSVCG